MSTTSPTDAPEWVYNRILAFFNQAQNIEDILDGTIQDDPANGPGNTLGETVAARILRTRNELPFRRFTEFSQIDNIQGVGPDTIRDLIYSFGTPADLAFVESMYNGVIFQTNWALEYDRTEITDSAEFQTLMNDETALRNFVIDRIEALCTEKNIPKKDCKEMTTQLSGAYIDPYSNSTSAAGYAFALWFYEFDADNWFSWEMIQDETLAHFDYHMGAFPWFMGLRFFKGFEQKGIIRSGITPPDLPVVVNEPEQTVTLWFSALYD